MADLDSLDHVPDLLALAERRAAMEALAEQRGGEDQRALRYIAGIISVQLSLMARAIAEGLRLEMRGHS